MAATRHRAPEEFKIVLEPLRAGGPVEYRPGSEVRGTLLVKVNTNRHYSRIVINLVGKGYVRWTKTSVHITGNNGISNFTTSIAQREANKLYIDLSKSLWNKVDAKEGYLPAGRHSFPFQFVLPDGIPSSHDSNVKIPNSSGAFFADNGVGWTKYILHGRIERDNDESHHHRTEQSLTVKENVSIDAPNAYLPIETRLIKTAGCFSCISGSATITLTLPKTGFCIGEEIPYRVTIENGSGKIIEAVASLEEHIVYHTTYRKCYPKVILHGQVNNGPVQPGHTTVLSPEVQAFKIPTSVILTRNSSIIKQSFMVKVKVRIPRVIGNPTIKCPLSIGNLPSTSQQEPPTTGIAVAPPPEYSSNGASGSTLDSVLHQAEPPSYRDADEKVTKF